MKSVSDRSCGGNHNIYFMSKNLFPESRAVNEIMWKKTVERDRPQMTLRRMRFACWITKLQTHTQNM
jgi:hypothetical protein